jgi:hypothetical protein
MITFSRMLWALLLLSATASVTNAQPNLTGEWQILEESGDSNLSPIGRRGTIVQTPQTLTTTPIAITRRPSNLDGKSRTFRFDGSEVRDTGTSATGDAVLWVSQSRWISSVLLITTSHPRTGDSEGGWTSMTILSLRSGGYLEILMISPNLWPSGTTATMRFAYRRTS